jgi:hypothetical protein
MGRTRSGQRLAVGARDFRRNLTQLRLQIIELGLYGLEVCSA